MSILSQFFQGRHKNQQTNDLTRQNETIAAIFTQQYNAPKPQPTTAPTHRKPNHKKRQQPSSQEDDEQEIYNKKPIKSSEKKGKSKIEKAIQQNEENGKTQIKQKTKKIKKREKKQKLQQSVEEGEKREGDDDEGEKNEQPENLESTVFVGNIPLSSTHQSVKKYFEKFGKVKKVWFRSIPVEQSKIPRKGLHILKKYQEGADSMNAYVKFEQISEASAACAANGEKIGDNNIKVTMCKQYDLDYETTIFIGNLPHKIKDQQLWDIFQPVGAVKSVRVIRNKQNFESIGIAYVRFGTKEQMKKAITEMNGKQISGRPMRIKKAVSKERLEKKVRKIKQNKEKKLNKTNQYEKSNHHEKTNQYEKSNHHEKTNQYEKSSQYEKTGKGVRVRGNPQNQFQGKGLKNSNYDKTKPINKKRRESKPEVFEKKSFPQRQVGGQMNKQSNQIIRSKFGFHGKKIMLQ